MPKPLPQPSPAVKIVQVNPRARLALEIMAQAKAAGVTYPAEKLTDTEANAVGRTIKKHWRIIGHMVEECGLPACQRAGEAIYKATRN